MKKALATAGKTAIEFVAAHVNLFAAAILVTAVVKVMYLGPAVLESTVTTAASLTVLLLLCMCYSQSWKIQELLEILNHTIEERDAAEQDLELERIGAHSPMSWDELFQLKDGADADPVRVQLAWMRHRKEQAEVQQMSSVEE